MRLIHLTDPHLSTLQGESFWQLRGKRRLGYLSWARRRRHLHRRDILACLSQAVAGDKPDVIAVTGDLVHIALEREIGEARAWLDELSAIGQVVLVPGNHDVYQQDAVAAIHRQWASPLRLGGTTPEFFPSVQTFADLTLIGLSSACPEPFWSAGGELGGAQLDRFRQTLDASAGTLRCVLIHHPPLTHQCAGRKALRDAADLEALLAQYRVELVLHGHIHHNRETLFMQRTRVLATASASNVAAGARASYRIFDIAGDPGGWRVEARLRTVNDAVDGVSQVSADSWTFARSA